ncbi:MAG TPA: response regulator [Chthoniobacteraceae bacterium]
MKETILVVDDEPDALELIRRNFAAAGFQVLEGRTGEEALYLARMHKPHLVILDHWLPGVNGLEVCRTLKMASETANIPVIMLTANNT